MLSQTLFTKDGRKCGNGICTGYAGVFRGRMMYDIETDFGNVMTISFPEVIELFHIGPLIDLDRWREDRDALRSRSSMAEQGTVDAQDVGSVPTVTAT